MFKDIRSKINFYRYRTNIHKFPVVSKLLCYIGRHDFEYSYTKFDDQGDPEGAKLECFYCLQGKNSILSRKDK